jgi:hypothetical protein
METTIKIYYNNDYTRKINTFCVLLKGLSIYVKMILFWNPLARY